MGDISHIEEVYLDDTNDTREWIDKKFSKEERAERKKLDISYENLKGELDLSDFTNLKYLDCSYNELTNLNISDCRQLKFLNCGYNKLTNLDLTGLNKLKELKC